MCADDNTLARTLADDDTVQGYIGENETMTTQWRWLDSSVQLLR